MSAVDPCPDDLLARAPDELLGPADRAILDAHLARCADCRTALVIAAALRAEATTLVDDDLVVARLASRARQRTLTKGRHRLTGRRWRSVATALLLVGGAAAASVWHSRRASLPDVRFELGSGHPPDTQPRPPESSLPAEVSKAIPLSASVPAPTHRRRPIVADSASLLRQAREARASGDRARAIALYQRIEQRFEGSPSAAVAEIAVGTLLLEEQSDEGRSPRAALAEFDHYLASEPGGALREEALVGRARALESLGERAKALAAWRSFLDLYPRSLQASAARSHLAALRGSGPSAGER
jgi:tetratricopeptide (TPR) repeat protein